jgi:TM2 domain-containing membrane protein YozV
MSENHKGNLGDEFRDSAKEFAKGAEETAKEFRESWNETTQSGENKKLLAGILAIVLGGFGIHKFILGYTKEGMILLVCTLLLGGFTFGRFNGIIWIITVIEGIIYLTKSDEEFYQTYQVNKRPWF